MKKFTLFSASALAVLLASMAPRAVAQTYVPMHARMITLAGNDTGVTNTLTIQVAALTGSATLTLPGGNTAGVLLNDGAGSLSWVPVSTIVSGLYLPTAGGTMTGNINMGGKDITNAGSITATTFNGSLNGNASTATTATNFSGSLTGDVTGTQGATVVSNVSAAVIDAAGAITNNTSGTAANATNAANIGTTATSTNASYYPVFVASSSSGNQAPDINSSLSYNPSTGTLTATNFSGALSGNATGFTGSLAGEVTGTQGATQINTTSAAGGHIITALTNNAGTLTNNTSGTAANATNAANIGTTATSTNASYYPVFVASSSSGNQAPDINSSLSYNPSTGTLTATNFSGALSGNATGFTGSLAGDVTGTQGATHVAKINGDVVPADAAGVLTNNGTGTLTWSTTAGAVTSISVASAHGLAGSSSGGTTPTLTLSTTVTGMVKGDGTSLSAATAGTDYSAGTSGLATGILKSTTGTGALSIAVAGDFPTLNQNTTGTASNVTGIVSLAHGGTGQDNTTGIAAHNVFADNGAGGATFRTLTTSDLPSLGGSYIINGTSMQQSANFNISGVGTATNFTGLDSSVAQPLTVRGGNSSAGMGGALTLKAGSSTSAAGDSVALYGGAANSSGAGGSIYVRGGNAAGTNMAGGNITLMPGSATGTGTRGGIGINTTSPNVDLDVNGDYATRTSRDTIASGAHDTLNDVSTAGTSNITLTGDTTGFAISGFANGFDGKRLRVYNKTGHNMTILNQSTKSASGDRINTLSGGDITLVGAGSVEFVYDDGASAEWVAASTLATQVTGIVGTPQNLLRATNREYTAASSLTNDSDFSWSTGANETWEIDGVLSDSADNNNATLGVAVNVPGTPTAVSVALFGAPIGSNPTLGGTSLIVMNRTVCANPLSNGTHTVGIGFIHGVFTTGSTSGTTFLQFNNPGSGDMFVRSDSYVRVTRLF